MRRTMASKFKSVLPRALFASSVVILFLLFLPNQALAAPRSISGAVKNASNVAISGVTMTLSGAGTGTTTTDASGNYTLNATSSGTYTVTPTKTNYTFSPTSLSYTNMAANQTAQNYTGTSTVTYTISGHIQNASAVAISGVTVTLSGGQSGSTTTNASGNYSFASLPSTNNYIVTPTKTNYTFSATSLTYNNLSANQTSADFTATATVTYTISGNIQNASAVAISGVTMTLSGAQSATTTTDGSGNYSLASILPGMNYTVTPSKTNYTFSPTSLTYNALAANQTTADFTGTSTITYTISGHIQNASGVAIASVTVTLSGGQAGSTTTDASGNYSITGLPSTNNYTITPTKTNYTFSAASLSYNNLSANQTTADFAGTSTVTYTISGHIQNASAVAIASVTVTLSGGQAGSTTTDASGNYSFAGLPSTNDYTVTPSKTDYTFSAVSLTYNALAANQTAADFTGTLSYTISGHIQDGSSAAISGVTVTLSGGQSATTATDAGGNYIFTSLTSGGSYQVTPTKTSYSFNFAQRSWSNIASNQTGNFTGTFGTYTISGHIQDTSAPISGVTVTISGGQNGTTTTDASGNYSFTGVSGGGSYSLSASKPNLEFNPVMSGPWTNLSSDKTVNFTGKYIISGHIQNGSGTPISGVTIAVPGNSATTDASGNYSLGNLSGGLNYTITPSKAGYAFSPVNLVYNGLNASYTNADFTGTLVYTISGHIQTAGATAISGVTVTLSDGQASSTSTNASGYYSFANVPSTNNYTVTPSKTSYTFSPTSLSYNNLSANQTTADFTGTLVYSISGHIQNASATPVSGVTVTLSGGQSSSTTTDASGNYSFASLPSTNNYTITPTKTNYTFSAASLTYNNLSANQTTADFTGTSTITYTISGHIENASAIAIAGVTVTLSGGQAGSTTTDASGNYSFANLPSTNNYTVTPTKTNYTFSAASLTYNTLSANQTTAHFTGTSTVTYIISGHIQNASGVAISGVNVTLSGGQSSSTTTDGSGNYSFTDLPSTNNYTVTPSKANYTFSAASLTYSNLSATQSNGFTGTSTVTYTISGHIQNATAVATSGVTVSFWAGGALSGSTTTDASGNYSFAGLPSTDNYTVTPSSSNHTFSPASLTYNGLSSNQTSANFTSLPITFEFEGSITDNQTALGIEGVTMALSGSQSATVSTNSSGSFIIEDVPAGGNYILTPSKTNYVFSPVNRTYNDLSANEHGANFTATLLTYIISGHLENGSGNAISGATMTLSGGLGTTTTDGSGNYSFADLPAAGSYTITPTKSNYTFSPADLTFNNLGANEIANFTGTSTITYTISGHIQNASATAISGVTVTLSGGQAGTTTTDESGNYSFAGLPSTNNYTVTPTKTNYTFSAASLTYNNLGANQTTAHFTGTLITYTVSGHVQDELGTAISGVTMTMTTYIGDPFGSTTTDASGNYSFANVPSSTDQYQVEASKANFMFGRWAEIYVSGANISDVDFVGGPWIHGRVYLSSGPQTGVTVTLTGAQTQTATTDQYGYFGFQDLDPTSGNYTLTPSKAGYVFAPVNQSYTAVNINETNTEFVGTEVYTISGHIQNASATAISGVTVTLSGGQVGTTTTDGSGNYSFIGLASTNDYTVTPSKTNYTFSPTSLTYNALAANQTTADFTGTSTGVPDVTLTTSVSPTGSAPPGTDLVYTISFSNGGTGPALAFVITDPKPANTDFKLGSMTTSLGTTGLTPTLAYSDNGGTTWAYTPASSAGGAPAGYDRTVTHVRWSFAGSLSQTSPNNAGSVGLTVRIR